MPNATYTLDGVPMDHPAGCWRLKDGTRRRPLPGKRAVNLSIPGRDGEVPITGLDLEATTFPLVLGVYGVDPSGTPGGLEALEANLEALGALLGTDHRLLTCQWIAGSVVREAPVKVETVSEPDYRVGAAMARLTAVVKVPGVYWRDTSGATWTGELPGASQIVATLAGSTGPITDAVLQVTGPAVTPSLTDVATGTTVSYAGSVLSGEYLLIDCGQMRASITTSGTFDVTEGTEVTGDVDATGPGSAFRWLNLTPAVAVGDPHSRAVLVTAAALGTSGASQVKIRARRCYR